MCVCVCRVVCVDRTRPRRRVYVRTVSQYGERTDRARTFWKTYTVGDGTNRIHGCFVVECMESLCVYIVVHAHRARECTHARAWMRVDANGIDACVHSSVVDARGDGRERRANRDDRHRSHRTSLSFPSLSRLDRSIGPTNSSHFIHSFIPLRPKGRTHEGTNEPRDDALERDATDERREILDERRVRSHRARRERYARLERTTRRIAHSLRARILNPVSYTHLTLPTKRIV